MVSTSGGFQSCLSEMRQFSKAWILGVGEERSVLSSVLPITENCLLVILMQMALYWVEFST